MEVSTIRRVGHEGGAIDLEHSGGVGAEIAAKVPRVAYMEKSMAETRPPSSSQKQEAHELDSAKAEMDEVRDENQRLKMFLDKVMKDYRTLQMEFQDIVQQEPKGTSEDDTRNDHEELEESELVSLSLGRSSSESKKDAVNKDSKHYKEEKDRDLVLGFDLKTETSSKSGGSSTERLPNASSPSNSSEVPKEDAGETWPPSKVLKTLRSTGDDEGLQQNPAKKARVCVRARCDTPTMNDGCQWRKYGQKIAKGNPCPRAYYRCTIAPSCPVRKQVQRCAEDMSILITTYEGTHNHPLPISATAMASTTSAAASMLLSGSSSSQSSFFPSSTTPPALHGANFYLSDGSKPKPYYLSNTSVSSSSSFPTITLDLTANQSSSSQFNRFSSSCLINPPRYSSNSLNFNTAEANTISLSSGLHGYGNTQPYISNRASSMINIGRQSMENMYNPYMHKSNASIPQQSLYPDAIAAATKAITADPSFQSALAVALSSIIGAGGSNGSSNLGNQNGGENISQKLKWSELFPATSTLPSTSKVNVCASTLLNKPPSTNSQPGSLMFLPPSSLLPFASSKGSSTSSNCDKRDSVN